ncbi:DUF1801 domain-containing protein [Demequina oxidasica]|uniref:DUF1801 domain-containing protein n=1 Tax=Demequina oxidasica TaxID=676199 RepID=UPI0007815F83|nr:DUF1801 domain-containing protein [Demequina oxidasica]
MDDAESLPQEFAAVLADYPDAVRNQILALRILVLEVASATSGVGELSEELKWGQPSFLTRQTGSGTTVRIDRAKGSDDVAVFTHCQTPLVDDFRAEHGDRFRYDGKRAIVFASDAPLPEAELREHVRAALTYHSAKRARS